MLTRKNLRHPRPKVYLRNLWTRLRQGHFGALVGRANDQVRERAFAQFYQSVSRYFPFPSLSSSIPSNRFCLTHLFFPQGHGFAEYEATGPVPRLVASAHGVVLDLGPGTGNQLDRFDAARVAHVYGVEPNAAFREGFLARLRSTPLGVGGKYTLVNAALEDIVGDDLPGGMSVVREGGVDCVVSMQVMVSSSPPPFCCLSSSSPFPSPKRKERPQLQISRQP